MYACVYNVRYCCILHKECCSSGETAIACCFSCLESTLYMLIMVSSSSLVARLFVFLCYLKLAIGQTDTILPNLAICLTAVCGLTV